jgi:hypothetical protein
MNKKIILLGGLLALQAVLIAFTSFQSKGLLGHAGMQTLLEFNREQVDRIVLSDGDEQVELQRSDPGWTTADAFPVEADRVDRLLERLKGLEHGLVVAQTQAALKRFNLTDDTCERQLQLYADGKEVAALTLGSGAGARRSHVRVGDSKEVYAVTLASYDLPVEIGQWQDKTLLQIEDREVSSVQIGDLTIRQEVAATPTEDEEAAGDAADVDESAVDVKEEAVWVVDDLAEDQQFEAENFKRDFDRLLSLRYNRAYTGETLADLAESSEPENHISVQFADGSTRDYDLYKAKDGGEWLVKVSDREELFELSSYLGSRLGEQLVVDKLIKTEVSEEEAEISEASESSEAAEVSETAEISEASGVSKAIESDQATASDEEVESEETEL